MSQTRLPTRLPTLVHDLSVTNSHFCVVENLIISRMYCCQTIGQKSYFMIERWEIWMMFAHVWYLPFSSRYKEIWQIYTPSQRPDHNQKRETVFYCCSFKGWMWPHMVNMSNKTTWKQEHFYRIFFMPFISSFAWLIIKLCLSFIDSDFTSEPQTRQMKQISCNC